jgi:hypothetical protein
MKKSESNKSINNHYRPLSYSEGYIYDYKKALNNKNKDQNDLLETLIEKKTENNLTDSINSLSPKNNIDVSITETDTSLNSDSSELITNVNFLKINNESNFIKIYNPQINCSINQVSNDSSNNIIDNNNDNNNNDNNNRNNEIEPKTYCGKILKYLFKRSLMFMTHLTLISLFEILFFFTFISVYEDGALLNVISSFTKNVPEQCSSLNNNQKEVFTFIFNMLVNTTDINSSANSALNERLVYNKTLFVKSWIYFAVIFGINIILLAIKFIYRIKVNLLKILSDNLFMIIILGIYEYIFFTTIILKYDTISTPELAQNIVNKFDNCFI